MSDFMKISKLSLQMVLVVLRILNLCVFWFFVQCQWSEFMDILYVFNFWRVPGSITFKVIFVLDLSVASFLLPSVDLICSQVHTIRGCEFLWYSVPEKSSI